MGCCGSSLTEDQKQAITDSNKLDNVLNKQSGQEGKIIKLLLLGTGESGKSTIFKQMQILYQQGFSDFEKTNFKHVVRRNIVEAMQTLLHGCEKLGFALGPDSQAAAKFMLELDPLVSTFWQSEIVSHVKDLWENEPAIKQAYDERSKLQLLDSTPYLFDNVDRIGAADYTPSADDILRARLRTSGIVERMIRIHGVDFKFLDVGGQRNERRKWIHCFESVTAVIFVAAISEYDQVLYEDEKENRLHEAIRVFDNICNNKFFTNSAMILFLNKMDLFKEKLITRKIPLDVCFSDYEGENTVEATLKFIEKRFLAVTKKDRMVFVHATCATDTQLVQQVFEMCRHAILKGNLDRLGLG